MSKDLMTSKLDRQNILNNELAIAEIQKHTRIQRQLLNSVKILLDNAK